MDRVGRLNNVATGKLATLQEQGWRVNGYALESAGARALLDRFGAVYFLPTDDELQNVLDKLGTVTVTNKEAQAAMADAVAALETERAILARALRVTRFNSRLCFVLGAANLAVLLWGWMT